MTARGRSALEKALDRRTLRRMAGARSFERGEDYFADGQVRALAEHEGTLTARVLGTREYRVKLWVEEGDVEFSCTCPVGTDGAFCKHCVAVGLAWLEQGKEGKTSPGKPGKPSLTMDDVRVFLAGQEKDALVGMLMEQAMEDDRLRQRLLMKAARKAPKGLDIATYRQAIDDAVDTGGFVDYRSAHDYAQGVENVADSIEGLLKEGHAAEVIDLAEHALGAVEDAMGSIDDSDGCMGGILERLQEIHHAACRKRSPTPKNSPGGSSSGSSARTGTRFSAPRRSTRTSSARRGWPCTGIWRRPSGRGCRPWMRAGTIRGNTGTASGSRTSWRRWPGGPATSKRSSPS